MLCVAVREGSSATVEVWYDRRVHRALMSSYGRLKFAKRCVDFWAPYKIGEIDREMAPCGAVCCIRGRGERDG